ncbi:MAG: class F sortase [Ilumatobacteraceae bacterium]
MQLRIPAIKVKATIEYVGLTRGGAMDVPKKDLNVAWFSLGPRPGEIGSAVIAGHYSWRNHGEGGIFRNLDKLRKGDMLYIRDDKGKSLSFIVRDNRLYDFDEGAGEIFSPNDGNYLNLITCAGTWNSYQRSSTKRRVVFAELVQQIVDIAGPS